VWGGKASLSTEKVKPNGKDEGHPPSAQVTAQLLPIWSCFSLEDESQVPEW
jgi:hypothetical protein